MGGNAIVVLPMSCRASDTHRWSRLVTKQVQDDTATISWAPTPVLPLVGHLHQLCPFSVTLSFYNSGSVPASYNLFYGVTFAIYSPSFPCAIQIEAAYVLTPHVV